MLPISGWLKYSLVDYPGEIASVVFLQGCNFRCAYCHNPDLLDMPGRDYGPRFGEDEVLAHLELRRGQLDGICVTGGEPLLHASLPGFISRVKEAGFKVKIDTNGSNPEMLETLYENRLVDYIALDIKAPRDRFIDTARPRSGWENLLKSFERSIRILHREKIDYEFRTTIVAGLVSPGDFEDIATWLQGGRRYVLQRFRPETALDPEFRSRLPVTENFLREAKEFLHGRFDVIEERGFDFPED